MYHGVCHEQVHADKGHPLKGGLHNENLPNNMYVFAHEHNGLRGLYNLQD